MVFSSSAKAEIDFVHQVMPVLKKHCTECHTGTKKKGGLSINTRAELLGGSEFGEVVESGKAKASLMIKELRGEDSVSHDLYRVRVRTTNENSYQKPQVTPFPHSKVYRNVKHEARLTGSVRGMQNEG